MINIEKTIAKHNLIKKGETVAVACSGGIDSMCLLNLLMGLREKLEFQLVAINVDHNLRENSKNDSLFVKNFCDRNNIKLYSFNVDVESYCENKKVTLEQGARDLRYKAFKRMIDKHQVDKIALGHHLQDQAETILLNIFRGAGLSGACGMEYIRDNVYIRPLLNTSKTEIKAYVEANDIPFVEDETNHQNDYSRNYIRNMIMPLIRSKWSNIEGNICAFGDICRQDDEYINQQIDQRAILKENEGTVKIYSNYFVGSQSVVNRLIMKALKQIGVLSDIERRHLNIIRDMAIESENGSKISLPNGVSVIKEYNFITITNKKIKAKPFTLKLAKGNFNIPNVGVLEVENLKKIDISSHQNVFDKNKAPKDAIWRLRQDGDYIVKFGGGTKSLNEYLIDKKVPSRLRNYIPVLASGSEILVIAGVEISDNVKIDKNTIAAYGVNMVLFA